LLVSHGYAWLTNPDLNFQFIHTNQHGTWNLKATGFDGDF